MIGNSVFDVLILSNWKLAPRKVSQWMTSVPTCQDLSTMIKNRLKPIIFLINNDGYTIERVIVDRPYNDIQPWRYHKLVEVFGGSMGLDVHTEGELEEALDKAATADCLVFIEVHARRMDCPEALLSAGRSIAKANHLD